MLSLLRPPAAGATASVAFWRSPAPRALSARRSAAVALVRRRAGTAPVLAGSGGACRPASSGIYARVDHSGAYVEEMSSVHGAQLKLALEEGRGRDDGPFDPFSSYLDSMGSADESPGEGGDESGEDEIEEAEYRVIEDEGDERAHEEGDSDDDDDGGPVYTNTGALYRPKSERLALRAGYPGGGRFAVINLAGFQHKVTKDDLMVVNKLRPVSHWSVGSTHTVSDEDVLLVADKDRTLVGVPGVSGAQVDVMVEEITRDKTLIIFKKRRRKHSRRRNGFRRQVTFLRVLDIRFPEEEEMETEKDANMLNVGSMAA